jgi:hypothetical protein
MDALLLEKVLEIGKGMTAAWKVTILVGPFHVVKQIRHAK